MKHYIALFGLVLAALASAVDDSLVANRDIVDRAFDRIERDWQEEWAFTETSTEEEITLVARYDPRRDGEQWLLLSVDGREPTADEISDFSRDKGRGTRQNEDDDDREQRAVVNFDTLELTEETDEYWIFSFVPIGDDDDDEDSQNFMNQVDGTVRIAKTGHFVEYIDLRNDEPIKPAFSVRINRFVMRMTFGAAAPGGPIVPFTVDVEVKGRALLFVTFDEVESIRYTDYEYAGP